MRVLIIDTELAGLDLALRAADCGHDVRLFIYSQKPTKCGIGFKQITLVDDYRSHMAWAKDGLIYLTGNSRYLTDIDRYRTDFGFTNIFGPTVASARLEIDRSVGMEVIRSIGLDVPPFETFKSLEDAEAFARKSDRIYVFKPTGDEPDKSLTYVSKDQADMSGWIRRQIVLGKKLKGECMLQEKVDKLVEIGVSGWMGPEGFLPEKLQICFEHKSLGNDETGPACFTPDAEVLTRDGWKAWPDVTMEDAICSLDNGKIVFVPPTRMVCEDFDGPLVGWESPTLDILVTPGHNMYVQDDHYRKPFWFEPAIECFSKARTVMRAGGEWSGESVDLPSCARSGHVEWAALLGMYIADGNCKNRSIVFGNCPTHKQVIFIEIAKEAGFEAKMYGRDLYINNGDLAEYLRDFGYSQDKYVPQYIKDSSTEVIASFLFGYGTGDGTRRPANLTYSTVSRRLADDLHELCLKVGWAGSVAVRDRRGESHMLNGYECINRLISYEVRVSQSKHKSEISPENGYRFPYSGKVYCVTVPSHVIYVRRNGKSCWIGQTGEMANVSQYVEQDKLADEMLLPLEPILRTLGHRGDFAIGAMIDTKGKAHFLEFTARTGHPACWIQAASHRGDPIKWMMDLLTGKDSLKVSNDVAIGVVLAQPNHPYANAAPAHVEGVPIHGIEEVLSDIHLVEAMMGKGPVMEDGKVVERPVYQTAGEYVAVATALGKTVEKARKKVYAAAKAVHWPDKIMRTDAGLKVIEALPALHKHGYALDVEA